MSEAPKKINLRVHNRADGAKQLVFEVAGTRECVGEIDIAFVDAGYLPVFATMFTDWARLMQPIVKRNGNGAHSSIVQG